MLNLLVEIKNEYTTQLINILAPLIFQGIQSIYLEAKNIVKDKGENNTILKIFQSCLKSIYNWNSTIIENETMRIVTSPYVMNKLNKINYNYDWLNDLVKATLKSHITVLMFNPNNEFPSKINSQFYQNIKLNEFIHGVYIECAIELWNNPYLLYHDYPPIEIKRNHRDCIIIIRDCIKEAIRKLLPVRHILKLYLGDENQVNNINNDKLGHAISDAEENYLTKLMNKDLTNNMESKIIQEKILEELTQNEISEGLNQNKLLDNIIPDKISENIIQDKILSDIQDKISSHIQDNISSENQDKTSSEIQNKKLSDIQINLNLKNNKKSHDSIILDIINKQSTMTHISENNILDDKIKKILNNDLNIDDSDINTSIAYSIDNNYQDIFSNSNIIK